MNFKYAIAASILAPTALFAQNPTNHALLNKRLFTLAYENNVWGSSESRSGLGSTLGRTTAIREELPRLIAQYNIKSLLDAPCGDFNWMRITDLSDLESYIGLDIVEPLVRSNSERYGTPKRHFFMLDIINDPLPKVDLVLCRDCIQHLVDEDVFKLLKNIKRSGAKYLLASSYPVTEENKDLTDVYSTSRITYRNLLLAPFNLPKPLKVIQEGYENKALMLWKVSDLPDLQGA